MTGTGRDGGALADGGPEGLAAPALSCQDVVELLLDYVEQVLPRPTLAACEAHLAECAACRAYLATYRRAQGLPGAVAAEPMPAEVRERLRALVLGHRPDG